MGKITTKKRILFSFRGQVTINGQIMSEKPGIFCAQNGQKLWVFGQPGGGGYSVGKGILHVDQINIYDHKNQSEAVIKFEAASIADESGIIARCIKAARSKEAAV